MATADVTVRGAGVFGLAIAWTCVQRGARVQVIDPYGVGAGASGGIVGALAPHVPDQWNAKKQAQFDSLQMAPAFWAGVEAASGQSTGYGRTGRLQPLADAATVALARDRAVQAKTLWQGQEVWAVVPASDHPQWAPHTPSGWLVHDTLSARIHPRKAVRSLAAALAACGAEVVGDGPDQGAVVWATGYAGLTDLSTDISKNVGSGEKGQAILLQFDARNQPQLFANAVHIIPHQDGTTAIGSTTERDWTDATTTDHHLDTIYHTALAAFPILQNAPIVERWAGVRPRTRSRAPMLGHHPTKPGQFIANGGFKIGFGMAPLVAALMADLILSGTDHIPASFRPEASL